MTSAHVRFRPATLGDAEAVTALVNEREVLDRGVVCAALATRDRQYV